MDQWEMVLPPSRPTKEELQRIESVIDRYDRRIPVAILGSTPEFRELLSRLGFQNRYIFDKSRDFYNRMSNLIPESATVAEHLIQGEWLDTISEYDCYFQVILSDLTMGNIAYRDREKFYSDIAVSLLRNGVFIDKVLAFDFKIPTINELFLKYERLPINLRTINDFSSEVLFCSELVMMERTVNSSQFYKIIDNGNYSDKIKYFSRMARMITPEGFSWDYGVPWSELSPVYNSFYKFQVVFPEIDVESAYFMRTKQFFNYKS